MRCLEAGYSEAEAMIQLRNHSEYTQTLIYGDLEDVETDNAGIIVYRRKPVQIECACGLCNS